MTPQEKKSLILIIIFIAIGYGSKGLTHLGIETFNSSNGDIKNQEDHSKKSITPSTKKSGEPDSIPVSSHEVETLSDTGALQPEIQEDINQDQTQEVDKNNSLPIDLNSASISQLISIKGIGPKTAEKILQFRKQNGGFKSISDLLKIKGIGPKKLKKISPWVSIREF